jgi:hypothetical protein
VEDWLATADPAAWRRHVPGVGEAPLAAAWWADFVTATRGRWTAASVDAIGAASTVAPDEAWALVHPSGRQMRISWVAGGVQVCDPVLARCEQARLDAATREALRQGLRR